MKRIFITGSSGQLGGELKILCPGASFPTRVDLDLSNLAQVESFFKNNDADLIVNCAAYTLVDKAESDIDNLYNINVKAPEIMARYCKRFVQISTDYVFDGLSSQAYKESMPTSPVNTYGMSKLAGEIAIMKSNPNSTILRTSWLYSSIGNNFVKTMIRLGKEKKELKVVADQVGTPTYAKDLADVIVQNAVENWKFESGIYHFSNEGVASWFEFATEIMDYLKIDCQVLPIKTSEYPTIAKRPAYSVLDKTKIKNELGIQIPHWKESLKVCLQKLS